MPDSDHDDHHSVIIESGDHAVIPEAIAPVASVVANHRFTPKMWIIQLGYIFQSG
jgi:hypothetical protein